MSQRFALFYKNDAGSVCFRTLTEITLSNENIKFAVLGATKVNIRDIDELAIAILPSDDGHTKEGTIELAEGKYFTTRMGSSGGELMAIWKFLAEAETSPVLIKDIYKNVIVGMA